MAWLLKRRGNKIEREMEMKSKGSISLSANSLTPSQLDDAVGDALHMAPDILFDLWQGMYKSLS
jgi:hypothetical protein